MFSTPDTGKQGDVLRGQRLHQQERDGVPDTPGQVRRRLEEIKEACSRTDRLLCVCVQSVNGAGGQGEGHDRGPERSAHQEETLLQVNSRLGYSHNTEIRLDSKHRMKSRPFGPEIVPSVCAL